MSIVKVICKKKKASDKLAYLRLSTRIGNKTVLRNLKLSPIDPKHFNPNTGRLRASFPEAEYYNNFIESKLNEINKKGNSIKFMNDENKSLIDFIERVIERTENQGTIMKYNNIKNLIVAFNEHQYGTSDIKFSELTVDFLEAFRKYLKSVRKNKQNSIVYKMKCFKSFISKAAKDKEYTYDVNPFDLIKNTLIETTVDVLNKDDLKKLMNTPLIEVYRSGQKFGQPLKDISLLESAKYKNYKSMNDIRNFFLFQLFCQGIRVSDLLTLRWQDFYIHQDQIRIKKRMVKVRSYIDVFINFNTLDYLYNYIPTDQLPENLITELNKITYSKISLAYAGKKQDTDNTTKVEVNIESQLISKFELDFKNVGGKYFISVDEILSVVKKRLLELEHQNKKKDSVQISEIIAADEKIIYLNKLNEIITEKLHKGKNDWTDDAKEKNYQMFIPIIDFLSNNKETKRMFCFPLLNDGDFSDIPDDDFSAMNEYQYSKFTGTRAYYNRLLKCIANQCGINKTLTSHLSRHSFTSLMIEIGENLNLFDLMTSLGHKHLNTTQVYINKFSSKRVDNLSKNLVDYIK